MATKAELEKHYKALAAQYFAALVELVGEDEARRMLRKITQSAATITRNCPQCKKQFEAGGGASRRVDAKFCSNKCLERWHNEARR